MTTTAARAADVQARIFFFLLRLPAARVALAIVASASASAFVAGGIVPIGCFWEGSSGSCEGSSCGALWRGELASPYCSGPRALPWDGSAAASGRGPGVSPGSGPGASPWAGPGASLWSGPGASSRAGPGASSPGGPAASLWGGPGASLWGEPGPSSSGGPGCSGSAGSMVAPRAQRSEEHTSELQSPYDVVCRLLLEK